MTGRLGLDLPPHPGCQSPPGIITFSGSGIPTYLQFLLLLGGGVDQIYIPPHMRRMGLE